MGQVWHTAYINELHLHSLLALGHADGNSQGHRARTGRCWLRG